MQYMSESRDLPPAILHIDMDSFFVSVELLDRPELRGKAVAVAVDLPRSVISTASYEARRFGVHSAMPVARAKQLCPGLILIDPNMHKYRSVSRRVMDIFLEFTPHVEALSIDEAFLDVTGSMRLFGQPGQIAETIRKTIRDRTGLTASVGIASTKFVAKIASQRAKPNGALEVQPQDTLSFLHPLPVGELWSVGSRTEHVLRSRGIHTVGDLARTPRESLVQIVGVASAENLFALAHGCDPRVVHSSRLEKSVSHEETFMQDEHDRDVLRRELLRLSEKTAQRLRDRGVWARTIAVKIRWDGFETITRTRSLSEATQSTQRIYRVAEGLFTQVDAQRPVRLIGVRAENLVWARESEVLWSENEHWDAVDQAVDRLRHRFGNIDVKPAALIGKPSTPERPSDHVPRTGE